MKLSELEEYASAAVFQRGEKYFSDGAVLNLEEISPGSWSAEVAGGDVYNVHIELKGNKIIDEDCNCPYDGGGICKHIVAVSLAIMDAADDEKQIKKQTGNKKSVTKSKAETFDLVVKKVKEQELKEFVMEYASQSREFRNLFMIRFNSIQGDESKEKYELLIKRIIESCSGRYGFIDYSASFQFGDQMGELLGSAKKCAASKNYRAAMNASEAVMESLVTVLSIGMDDSSGVLGSLQDEAMDILQTIAASDAAIELKDELFDWCLEQIQKGYSDYGLDSGLYHLTLSLCNDVGKEGRYRKALDKLLKEAIEKQKSSNSSSDYSEQHFVSLIIDLLRKTNKHEEAQQLIKQNIHLQEMRQLLVDEIIKNKKYDEAKKLINEGIEIAKNKRHPGTVSNWQEQLLKVAFAEKDTPAIRTIASAKMEDRGYYDMNYYRVLKKTYTAKEWDKECQKIIEEVKTKKWYGQQGIRSLANIFIEEQFWDRLLKLAELNPVLDFIENIDKHLESRYPKELLEIFAKAITTYAHQHTGRNEYVYMCKALKRMMKLHDGKEKVKSIVEIFMQQYKPRRAMIEELNKLVKSS